MEDGKALEEAKVKEALETNGLKLGSLEVVEVKVPKAAYVLQAAAPG